MRLDLKHSLYEGMFANMFATLTGGVFLTGFALYLGMNEFMIGLVASMPFVGTVFQLPASYLIAKKGGRKKIACWAAALARSLWVPVLVVVVVGAPSSSMKLWIILGLMFLSYAFVSVSYVSWLSWMSDLVSEKSRGSFFGTRNMLCGAAGIIVLVIFGRLLDLLNGHSWNGLPLGFGITFLSAVSFGMLSLYFLHHITEPQHSGGRSGNTSLGWRFLAPFKESNFRKFLVFSFLWSFSVYCASPFFTLYFLRDLRFSYSFVATLGTVSAVADVVGMRLWGKISDKVKNKAVVQFTSWVAIFLPLAWVVAGPGSVVVPVILHVVGGGFWAGINLCTNNLLLRISPQEKRTSFLAMHNILAGVGAAAGPILGGFALKSMGGVGLSVFSWSLHPVQIIFLVSTVCRLLSFQLFRYVHEPEEVSVARMVRILRSVRGLNMASGFNYLLHPFIEDPEKRGGF